MSEAKHTPLPWVLGDPVLHQGVMSRDVFNESVGKFSGGFVVIASEGDAAFIVTAVNTYDANQREIAALREALRGIQAAAEPIVRDPESLNTFAKWVSKVIGTALGKER